MKIQFDEKADAVYLRLDDSSIVESEEVHPGIVLDFNGANQVVGIEILGVWPVSSRSCRLSERPI